MLFFFNLVYEINKRKICSIKYISECKAGRLNTLRRIVRRIPVNKSEKPCGFSSLTLCPEKTMST